MTGATLGDIRATIEALASEDGTYYLVCARHGDRPVPAAGLRFATRATARAAASATEQYRATLRRYDPRLPRYDIVVCQEGRTVAGEAPDSGREPPGPAGGSADRDRTRGEGPGPGPRVDDRPDTDGPAGESANRIE